MSDSSNTERATTKAPSGEARSSVSEPPPPITERLLKRIVEAVLNQVQGRSASDGWWCDDAKARAAVRKLLAAVSESPVSPERQKS